ncbi:hypothetical protein [Vibrio scophthalmi]|uniref:hypothetical protein n=1 Tax=Vibrio scophthalmi TaxID=45658 RepID=UPI001585D6B9|nr:hypothetical protein [Vibrio scophthalmi]
MSTLARSQFAEKQIRLSATITAEEVSGNLISYVLDGDYRRLYYDDTKRRFNPISFYVRTESELGSTPGDYSFVQTFNNISCYGGPNIESLSVRVIINGNVMASNRVDLTGSELWYQGADKLYSDVVVEMTSPEIWNYQKKQCVGRVSLLVGHFL